MASIINSTTTAGVTVTGDNSGSLQLATNNGTTAVTVTTAQLVGIGTSSPDSKLHVKSTVNDNTNGLTLEYDAGTAYYGRIFSSGNDLTISADTGNTGGVARFLTGGTERMRINSSGQVTIPYQPAFRAFTGTSFTGNTVVIFNSTQFNTGSHYSTSTGRFTAPISGRYFFTFYLLSANGYTGGFWGGLRLNGSSLAFSEMDWPGNYRTIASSTVVQLTAGDYVEVIIAQGDTYAGGGSNGEWSAFSGYLIG